MTDITHILEFLACPTPPAWLEAAARPENLPTLLADHANCERKAAESAMAAMKRYAHGVPGVAQKTRAPGAGAGNRSAGSAAPASGRSGSHDQLLNKLSRLAREELRHFEQVIAIMRRRNIPYRQIGAARYAGKLHALVRSAEPGRLVDTLIVGALIEARSCERFAMLAPLLETELGDFYRSLLKSESRHFADYLALARQVSDAVEVDQRLQLFLPLEAELITGTDAQFRFHSGVPAA